MSSSQDQQHLMYQNPGYGGYQSNTQIGAWGQQQQAPPSQMSYQQPVSYQQEGMTIGGGSYAEKAAYGTYTTMQYAGGDNSDYYRQVQGHYSNNTYPSQQQQQQQQQPSTQTSQAWSQSIAYPQQQQQQQQQQPPPQQQQQQQPQQQYTQSMYFNANERGDSCGAAFNPGAPPPNMNRPPPQNKRDPNSDAYHPSLAVLESSGQCAAAAYTASWVSSTSSIPPELKDEPEREDMMFSGQANFVDQFSNMGVRENKKPQREETTGQWDNDHSSKAAVSQNNSQQWPGLGQQEQNDGSGRGRPQRGDDRRATEERPLTWEERLKKAQVQKERVEQRGGGTTFGGDRGGEPRSQQNGEGRGEQQHQRGDRDDRRGQSGRGRGGSSRGNGFGRGAGGDRYQRDNNQNENERGHSNNMGGDGHGPRGGFKNMRGGPGVRGGMGLGGPGGPPPPIGNGPGGITPPFNGPMPPMPFPNGGPPMMMPGGRGGFMRGPPPMGPSVPQDTRFRNTWLDANAFMQPPFPMAMPPMFPPVPLGRNGLMRGGRGGRGGRGMMNHRKQDGRNQNERKTESASPDRTHENEQKEGTDKIEPTVVTTEENGKADSNE